MFLNSLNRCFHPRLCFRWIFGRVSNFCRKWLKIILITISRTSTYTFIYCIYTILTTSTSNTIKTCINIISTISPGWHHSWRSQSVTSRSAPAPVIHSVSKPINLFFRSKENPGSSRRLHSQSTLGQMQNCRFTEIWSCKGKWSKTRNHEKAKETQEI